MVIGCILPSSAYRRTWYDGYWKYSLSSQGKSSSSMFKECQKKRRRKKTSTLMGETCLYLYFDDYCIWFDLSCDMQNTLPSLHLPWNNDEPYPDHTWIARTFIKIPLKYLEDILTRSAYLCLKESRYKKEEGLLLLASDSTGIETDRYDYEVRPVKERRNLN